MTLSLQGFKDEFHEKNVSAGIAPDELNAYLAQSYKGENPLYLTALSTTQEKKAFYNQAKALYRIGKDQGLTGFKELSGKFKEFQSEKEPDYDYHNINEIKKSMEGIVFQIDKDKESGKELDPKLNDYPFLCGDGTNKSTIYFTGSKFKFIYCWWYADVDQETIDRTVYGRVLQWAKRVFGENGTIARASNLWSS